MRRIRVLVLSVAAAAVCSVVISDDGEPEEHPALTAAREDFKRQMSAATDPVRRRYVSELDSLKRTLTLQRDEEGVAAVEAELERIDDLQLTHERHPLQGTWKVTYSNGGIRNYQITSAGAVRFVEGGQTGQIVSRNGEYLLDFGDGKLERLRFEPAIVIEHFDPKTLYPNSAARLEGHATIVSQ